MSEEQAMFSLPPEAFNYLRSFDANGRVDALKIASMDYLKEVSAALTRSVKIVCQIDQELLQNELLAKGVPKEAIASICGNLIVKGKVELQDCGLPWHLRKNPIF